MTTRWTRVTDLAVSEIDDFVVYVSNGGPANASNGKTVNRTDETTPKRHSVPDEKMAKQLKMGPDHRFTFGVDMPALKNEPVGGQKNNQASDQTYGKP